MVLTVAEREELTERAGRRDLVFVILLELYGFVFPTFERRRIDYFPFHSSFTPRLRAAS